MVQLSKDDEKRLVEKALAARDEELTRGLHNMRVMVTRLEELLDAPSDAELAKRVCARLGIQELTPDAAASHLREMEEKFVRACYDYFILAGQTQFGPVRLQPVHVTTHLPSKNPLAYIGFFEQKLNEDLTKVNLNHIGDLMFRMAFVIYRAAKTKPRDEDILKMHDILYGKGQEGWHRVLQARRRGEKLESRYTPFEDDTKVRFYSIVLTPGMTMQYFDRLRTEYESRTLKHMLAPDYFVTELWILARAMRVLSAYDYERYRACYRVYKQHFTQFVLDEHLEDKYAVQLLMDRHKCGMRSKSIASRAGPRADRYNTLIAMVNRLESWDKK